MGARPGPAYAFSRQRAQRRNCHCRFSFATTTSTKLSRVLKKKMQRERVFREMKQRRSYENSSERRNREKSEAIRRARKLARKKAQREGLIPMPKPHLMMPYGALFQAVIMEMHDLYELHRVA